MHFAAHPAASRRHGWPRPKIASHTPPRHGAKVDRNKKFISRALEMLVVLVLLSCGGADLRPEQPNIGRRQLDFGPKGYGFGPGESAKPGLGPWALTKITRNCNWRRRRHPTSLVGSSGVSESINVPNSPSAQRSLNVQQQERLIHTQTGRSPFRSCQLLALLAGSQDGWRVCLHRVVEGHWRRSLSATEARKFSCVLGCVCALPDFVDIEFSKILR